MKRIILASLLLSLLAANAAAQTLVHDGQTRTYLLRRADDAREMAPALFILHGGGIGTAEQIAKSAAAGGVAQGFVYVFPNGLNDQWNDGRTGANGALLNTTDDVGFLSALAEKLIAENAIDRTRIYVAGISNGGMMAIRLACERADLFSGIGVVAAAMQSPFACMPSRATPAIFIHGDKDKLVTFDGSPPNVRARGGVKDRGQVLSIPATLAFWQQANRCESAGPSTDIPDRAPKDGTTAYYQLYQRCSAPLAFIGVEGGGHAWPGAAQGRIEVRLVGKASGDFDATKTMLTFFETGAIETQAAPRADAGAEAKTRRLRRRFRR